MNVQSASLLMTLGLAGLAACADDPAAPSELRDRLDERLVLKTLVAGDVRVAASQAGADLPEVEPAVETGAVVARTTPAGGLLLEVVDMALGDVVITKRYGTATQELHLTDLHLRLGTRGEAEPLWSEDGTRVTGVATADLLLDWALRGSNGSVIPLAMQVVRDAELGATIAVDADGVATATIDSVVLGPLWDFDDVAVRDLSLSLVAGEAP